MTQSVFVCLFVCLEVNKEGAHPSSCREVRLTQVEVGGLWRGEGGHGEGGGRGGGLTTGAGGWAGGGATNATVWGVVKRLPVAVHLNLQGETES